MWKAEYEKWKNFTNLDEELKQQLAEMDEKTQEDAFYKELEFGTAGMRGVLGPGTNRMNTYTVRKANDGFARYIASHGEEAKQRGIVIAYDCRHKSPEFSMESAKVMASYGIKAYVFESLRPTPELSYAVRELNAFAGIVITASHNPKEYNGYKIYDQTGCQSVPTEAARVVALVNEVENELLLTVEDEKTYMEQGLIEIIGEAIDAKYNDAVCNITINDVPKDELKIVFTPQHGTANVPVRRALETLGYTQVHIVEEQAAPDGDFPTVELPNPEDPKSFAMAMELGAKVDADILLAADPDADRVGVAVKTGPGQYELLNGNQTGALTFHYLVTQMQAKAMLPVNPVMFTTIVSSDLAELIATKYGVTTERTLTGFKFIGDRVHYYENTGEKTFIFGYEESFGSLVNSNIARDKDAVQAIVIAVEMAAFYKAQGKTLSDVLDEIGEEFGYFQEGLISMSLPGKDGLAKIQTLMSTVRQQPFTTIAGQAVIAHEDYFQQLRSDETGETIIELPQADVLKYYLADGSWFCLRPSGTEPKAKVYISAKKATKALSQAMVAKIEVDVMAIVNTII
ncbi:MAG: phospho-sugar mutase [Culicoidibacterales bacterium]